MRLAVLLTALALPAGAQQATLQTALPDTAFPTDFGGAYALTDHHGRTRTQADPDGNLQLIFFGYASCEAICTVALPIMSEMGEALAKQGIPVTPLVVTVDPERDTVDTMGPALAEFAPGLTGLTGSEADLAAMRDLFHVERQALFVDPAGSTVYAHGSHIFVMDGEGGFLTLLPPILSTERMVEIVAGYAAG
ncbi:SCO family protein [Jannaschia sp. S6380]|uniref:SCO family protein n=1 Tax=Jannaschia sp. S6380 TaxID=2926408 RepID=UPI001FF6D42A|nr:SCO family protein [Jannaschia sp. S6380]MCK0169075.1 SCO family protein [Jannaschia sp. S6380]